MTTPGERITHLRMHLRYSQRKFGALIGKTGASISRMENNEVPILEGTIDSLVLKFDINRTWLETGQGEMFNYNFDAIGEPQPITKEMFAEIRKQLQLKDQQIMFLQALVSKTMELGKLQANQISPTKVFNLNKYRKTA